jgi:hypothetical protein
MSAVRSEVAVCGFDLRIVPIGGGAFRLRRLDRALVVEVEGAEGWRAVTLDPAGGEEGARAAELQLAGVAHVEVGPSRDAWWVETPVYRIPLPALWTLHASGDRNAAPLFELLGARESSISIRTARRMPALESFQGAGHVFRDIGQLERAGWIEFEHTDASGTWLYRHEQFHRGTAPFVVTLKTPLDQASAHVATLAMVVEQLELSQSAT